MARRGRSMALGAAAAGAAALLAALFLVLGRDGRVARPAAESAPGQDAEAALLGTEEPAGDAGARAELRAAQAAVAPPPAAGAERISAPGPLFAAHLLDAKRRPLEGGVLFVRPPLGLNPCYFPGRMGLVSLPQSQGRAPSHVALSGADGRVELALEPGELLLAEGGMLELRALAPRCAAVDVRAAPPAAGKIRELGELVLPPGRTLRGRVVPAPGGSLDGARVFLSVCTSPDDEPAVSAEQELIGPLNHQVVDQAVLDAAGGFELAGVRPEPRTLWAYAPGTAFVRAEVPAGFDDLEGFVLALRPLAERCTVEGSVEDAGGAPVAGAFVHVLYAGDERAGTTVRSDAEGRFRAPLARPERFTLVVLDEGFWRAEARVEAGPCEHDVRVHLLDRPTFRAVVQGPSGERLVGSAVEVRDPAGAVAWHYGRRELEPGLHEVSLPPAPFGLRVTAPGHGAVLEALDPTAPGGLGEEVVVTLDLDAAVLGVVARAGTPIGEARVTLHRLVEDGRFAPSVQATSHEHPFALTSVAAAETRTDAEGRFAFSSAEPGMYFVSAAAELDAGATERLQIAPGAPPVRVSVELGATGAIAGRALVGPDATPAGVLVGVSRGDGLLHCAYTDAAGAFRVEALPAGRWQVRRCRDTFGEALPAHQIKRFGGLGEAVAGEPVWDCAVEAGATTRFDLDLRDEGSCVLEGRTSAASGGIAELRARGVRGGPPAASVSVGRDGDFRLALSAPGTFALLVKSGSTEIHGEVALVRGTSHWSYDPAFGTLVLLGPPDAPAAEHIGVLHVRREPGGLEVRTQAMVSRKPGGKRVRVPSGEAVVERLTGGMLVPPPAAPLSVLVPAGGEVQVVVSATALEAR